MRRTFTLVLIVVATLLAVVVAPLWGRAGGWASSVRESGGRILASPGLVAAYEETLCRRPTDKETVDWDGRPFDRALVVSTLGGAPEGERVRVARGLYFGVLRRDATPLDCAIVRDWVDGGLDVGEMTRHLRGLPEARRVIGVRRTFVETLGRDPIDWDEASLRRWVESAFTLAEIRTRLVAQRPLVGVHYFLWYRTDRGGWGNDVTMVPGDAPRPSIGTYESSDPAVIDAHIRQMDEVGLDFVIVHIVAQSPASWSNARTFFRRLDGRRLRAAVMLDGLITDTPAPVKAQWVSQVKAEFTSQRNYLLVHGQPLVMLFSAPLNFTVPGLLLRNVYWTDRYDSGRNAFNTNLALYPDDWPFWATSPQPLVNGLVPIVPGYVDRDLGRPRTMEYPRREGEMYAEQWARALELHPEFITIYSWNEYFERTAIEPTGSWGDQYVRLTACYVRHAHRGTRGGC